MLLGVATSWDKNKGLFDYLKLADLLGDNYRVVLVGLTKKQIRKLPKNVLGIERTANVRELAEIYTAADLFLNLSYCENYPTVNIEALACGTPVITYEVGGGPEIVRRFGGQVISKGNINGVVTCIEKCMNNYLLISFSAIENDITTMIGKYKEIYRDLN